MCGIVGYSCINRYDEDIINDMLDMIKHRGPDGKDIFLEDGVGFGFVRLSIIDLNNGMQPIFNEDGSLVLIFNGEIYNYKELREELYLKGHIFKTNTDSEVIIHGYEEYGNNLPEKLRGMFAFAIYDRKNKIIFGARDHFGIKPFYYYKNEETFIFGSEIKSFLPHPEFKKELFEEKLPDYLSFACIPGEETFFRNVYKLTPGHYFIYENNQMKISKYFEATFDIDNNKDMDDFVKDIDRVVESSVQKHELSDVPICSFLSSGVDSSYISYELSKDKKIRTYTIDYEEKKYSEAAHAKILSDEIGGYNVTREVAADEYFNDAKKIQYFMDEPLANPSANLLYYISEKAAEEYKVVLSGEGADEMFAGYEIYNEVISLKNYRMIPKRVREKLAKFVNDKPDFKGKGFIIRGSKDIEERYIGNSYIFKYDERDRFLKKKYESNKPTYYTKPLYDRVSHLDDVSKMQYIDFNLWLRQEILLKADKMSMANSIELRVPFLDVEVFNVARKIPQEYKVNSRNTKLALRKCASKKMNRESSNRAKLMFPSPLTNWLKEDKYYNLVKEAFEGDIAKRYFNSSEILKLLEEHKSGKRTFSMHIWVIYTFVVWYEVYFVDCISSDS